jgi:hypothetical protein
VLEQSVEIVSGFDVLNDILDKIIKSVELRRDARAEE